MLSLMGFLVKKMEHTLKAFFDPKDCFLGPRWLVRQKVNNRYGRHTKVLLNAMQLIELESESDHAT